ncbi:TPA: LamG domain-containing protein, partial [bacterium]|nr:LamG domain-containing protein [bacterium]
RYDNSNIKRWILGGGPEKLNGVGLAVRPLFDVISYYSKTNFDVFGCDGVRQLDPITWYHIAFVYDGSACFGYINNKLDFMRHHNGFVRISNNQLAIGSGFSNEREYFLGEIDEFKIYKRTLSADELKQNYIARPDYISVDQKGKLCESWGMIKGK